jgi:hypothetical protein
MRLLLSLIAVFLGLAVFLSGSARRVLSDFQHADQFVPAHDLKITNAECTNWNFVMFDQCTVTFASTRGGQSAQLTDWRFGPAPEGPVRLMLLPGDASVVTTDVSLKTLNNRIAFVGGVILTGLFFIVGLWRKAMSVTRRGPA